MTSSETFRVGVEKRYFEDYIPGPVHEFGPITVEEKQIIRLCKTLRSPDLPSHKIRVYLAIAKGPRSALIHLNSS